MSLAPCSYLAHKGLDSEFTGLITLPYYFGHLLACPYLFREHDGPRWGWRFALISLLDIAGVTIGTISVRAPLPRRAARALCRRRRPGGSR